MAVPRLTSRMVTAGQGAGDAGGTSELEHYMDKVFGNSYQTHFAPGTIAPGDTLLIYPSPDDCPDTELSRPI
jgi:hypothetical protein